MELFLQLMCVILIGGAVATEGADKYDESVDTESGKVCYFPFIFDAKAHSRCITDGKDRPWCALVKEIQGPSEENRNQTWDYCVIQTNGSATCHFPFEYQNVTYNNCTNTGREKDWCATSENTESGEWGYCKKPNVFTTSICHVNSVHLHLCSPGDVIRVLAAEYGVSEGKDCVASNTDYRILSAELNKGGTLVTAIENLKKACEFERKCVNPDLKSQILKREPDLIVSDYVLMTYRCEQEADFYLCSDQTICTPTNNNNYSLELLHVENCDFSQNTMVFSGKSCKRKEANNIDVTGVCDAKQKCQPLTEANREVYLGDVCIDSNKLVPLQCSTESIQVNFTNAEVNLSICPSGSFPEIIDVITEPICNNTLCCGDKTVSIFKDIKGACNWEEECTVSVNVSVTSNDTNNQTCVNDSMIIQTSLYHNCHRANYKCVGEYFSDTLCDTSSYINVTSAVKGVSGYNKGCKPSADDVAFVVSEEFPHYYEKILKACNGRTNCSNLLADAANAYSKTNGTHIITDYVVIEYVCEEIIVETTTLHETSATTTFQASDEPTSDADSSKSTVYVIADGQTGKTGFTMVHIIIIIIVGAAVFLVLVIVVVVVVIHRKKVNEKRKSLPIEMQSNDRPLNTYGETGEIPLGKDNTAMHVGDSYDDIREKELIRKSQLEGAYQEIPTTPNNRVQSIAGFSAYQNIDNEEKKKTSESKVEESNDQKPSSVCSEGAEYQDIGSMKNKERKSKLLSESGEGVAKKTIEEEGPNDDDTADMYSAKDPQAVEYAEVDKLRKSIKKPSNSTIPQDNELVENVFYEGLDNFKQPENTQSNVKGVDI